MKLVKFALVSPIIAISVAVFAALGAQAAVPESYTELKYIESTGAQWIDTKYTPGKNTRVVIRFQHTTSGSGTCFGFGASGSGASFRILRQKNGDDATQCRYAFNVNDAYGNVRATAYAALDTDEHVADIGNAGMTFDGEPLEKTESGSLTKNVAGTAYLFAMRAQWVASPSADSFFTGRIYSCKIYDGETLVRDFVPVLDANGKPILLDVAQGHNTPYANNATKGDDFTPGPVTSRITVKGHPSDYGEPSSGYGEKLDVEVGSDYTFTMPQGVCTNATKTEVYTCTGWILVDNEGVGTSGPELTKTVNFAGGVYTLTWNWTVEKGHFGRTLTVPSQYATIAAAVEAAEDGDTVLVSDGTYEITAPIHVEMPITVMSVNGAAVTTVKNVNSTKTDEGETHRVFFLNNADAVIDGFTITGGKATRANDTARTEEDYGLGVRIDANGGTVSSCIIENCTLGRKCRGGGVYMKSADAVFTNCIVRANVDSDWSGYAAGVFVTANGLITDCTISGNTVNKSDGNSKWGAGVYSSGARIVRTRITDNVLYNGTEGGAGIYHASGKLVMDNCLVAGNQSQSSKAGGLMIANGSAYVTNCTFTANSSASSSAGVYVASGKAPVFHGCIFADNVGKGTSSGACWPEIDPANATFAYCLCTKELPAAKSVGCAVGNPYFAADGFTPTLSSDALDLCPPEGYPGLATAVDVSGNPRLSGEKVDAGCAEYQYPAVAIEIKQPTRRAVVGTDETFVAKAYVRGATKLEYRWTADDGTDSGWSEDPNVMLAFVAAGHRTVSLTVRADGVEKDPVTVAHDVAAKDVYVVPPVEGHEPVYPYAGKTTAATNIAEALLAAADGSTVHVARGIYLSTVETVVDYGVNLVSEEGADVTELRIKGWKTNNTGDIPRPLLIDHKDAVVDGFTFSGGLSGSANSATSTTRPRTLDTYVSPADYGAGVRIGLNGGALVNCVITNCISYRLAYGGGFAMLSADGLISNCVIRANKSGDWKGHAPIGYMTAGLLTHSALTGNTANANTEDFGGLYMTGGRISHCVFDDNPGLQTVSTGVAIYQGGGTIVVDNTLIKDNPSSKGKGAVYVVNDTAYFTNCTFVGNSAASGSGGVTVTNGKKPTFYGCLFANNSSSGSSTGAGFPDITPASATFVNSYSTSDTKMSGCESGEAVFAADGFTPVLSSLFIDKCPSEDYADVSAALDFSGNPRLSGERVDAGCAEYQYPAVAIDIVVPSRRQLVGEAVPIEAKATIAGASLIEYRWDSDDGVSLDWSTEKKSEFRFRTAGNRTLTLTVRADGETLDPKSVAVVAAAKDVYVVPQTEGHEPAFPYDTEQTAATNVAEAVLAAADGSTVHVAAGLYCAKEEAVVDYAMTVVAEEGPERTELRIGGWTKNDKGDIPRTFLIDHKDAIVSGFTLSGGYGGCYNGPRTDDGFVSAADYGSGVRIGANGGTLANCMVTNCVAERLQLGAGVALVSDDAVVSNCVIAFNQAIGWSAAGAGVYMTRGLVTHSTILDNAVGGADGADNRGGGALAKGGRFSHCRFLGNRHTKGREQNGGGGAFCESGAPVFDNCLFAGNTSVSGGGGLSIADGTVVSCTFTDNASANPGAGVNCRSTTAVFRNCLIQGNTLTGAASATTNINATATGFTYCLCPEALPAAEGNVRATVELNSRFVPKLNSAAIDVGSLDGYESYLVGGTDLLGKRRIVCGKVDIGCCENQQTGLMLLVR